ncbi:hypothetical protein JCM17478_17560 [Thermopirellula anaerolimosa]
MQKGGDPHGRLRFRMRHAKHAISVTSAPQPGQRWAMRRTGTDTGRRRHREAVPRSMRNSKATDRSEKPRRISPWVAAASVGGVIMRSV